MTRAGARHDCAGKHIHDRSAWLQPMTAHALPQKSSKAAVRVKSDFLIVSDFRKRLCSFGERILADVGVTMAHGRALNRPIVAKTTPSK